MWMKDAAKYLHVLKEGEMITDEIVNFYVLSILAKRAEVVNVLFCNSFEYTVIVRARAKRRKRAKHKERLRHITICDFSH
jgi:Ulp1 family protease